MCLSCCSSIRSPENLKILEDKIKETKFPMPPWMIDIVPAKEFIESLQPDPEMVGKYGAFGVISHVFLNNPVANTTVELTQDNLAEIEEHGLCVISTGVDNTKTIWALQWKNGYVPKILEKPVNPSDYAYKFGQVWTKEGFRFPEPPEK